VSRARADASRRLLLGGSLAGVALLGCLAAAGCTTASAAAGRKVAIRMHYSHFEPGEIRVPHGVPVTFVLTNDDPIGHEFIVGDEALQQRHEIGTEPRHGTRATEVSLDALSRRTTTITFDRAGELTYACHLPGHFIYGMKGRLVVT
jgi:uncharacterized cupredoxin-like copper-binding protein